MEGAEGQGLAYAEVPPEDIAQINYISSSFGAEYGNGFAQFNVTTKGGTNKWHGSAYENVQNNIFQARNYFSQPGVAVTPFHWNMYGGTVGGPIKKNKAFFFFSYANNPTNQQSPGYFSMPTQAMKNGDFSGLPVTIYDPNSLASVGGVLTRTPLPGNKMNPGTMDPVAKAAEAFIPLPNYPYANQSTCATASGVLPDQCFFNNDYFVSKSTNNDTWYNDRFDVDLTPSNRLDESSMIIKVHNPNDNAPGSPLNGDFQYNVMNYNGQLSDFWTISPKVVNEARFSMQRMDIQGQPADYGQGYMQKIGLTGSTSQFFPSLSWSGYWNGGFNGEFNTHIVANTFVPTDVVTWVAGKHVFKFGGEFDRYQGNNFWNNNEGYNFSGIDTLNPADPNTQGLGYADFLFGGVSSWGVFTSPEMGDRSWSVQAFAQDDYKAKPNLTINIGLRWEAAGSWTEVQNRISNFDPYLPNPASGTFGAMCYGPSTPGCPTSPVSLKGLWSPRLGFAWQPQSMPNWSFRGGYGIYYEQNSAQTFGSLGYGDGWSLQGQEQSTDSVHPAFQLASGIQPSWYLLPVPANRQPSTMNGNGVNYNPYHQSLSFVQEWRGDVQRALGAYLFDVAYVGTHGNDLPFKRSINQVPQSLLAASAAAGANGLNQSQYRPNPTFQSINADLNDGSSLYQSLQLGLRREFASGMSIIANYTWSRTTDTGSATPCNGAGCVDIVQNNYDLEANHSRAASDVPSLVAVGVVYPLPLDKGKAFLNQGGVSDVVLGGWELSSIVTAHTGLVFTPVVGTGNLSGALDGAWFPNRLASGHPSHQSINEWFDPSAFAVPTAGTFGNSGRNILRDPSFANVDARITKNFKIPLLGDKGVLQLHADGSDLFNHPNFGPPNTGIGSSGAGQITSATTSRNLQFGARFAF
jgi:hypothetical protein